MPPDSSHNKKYNDSCFMQLSEILSKLQMSKVTSFRDIFVGVYVCNFAYIPHNCFFPMVIITN